MSSSTSNTPLTPWLTTPFRTSPYETPRTPTFSVSTLFALLYFASRWDPKTNLEAARLSFFSVFVAFELFVYLQVRDLGITVWPSSGFWRLVFGAGGEGGGGLVAGKG